MFEFRYVDSRWGVYICYLDEEGWWDNNWKDKIFFLLLLILG